MITLRNFIQDDCVSLVRVLNDADVTQFLSSKIPYPYTHDDAMWWVTEGSKAGVVRAIEVNGQLAGCIGVNPGEFEYRHSGEIGYWLAKEYWRQGIASEAIRQIVELVFTETELMRLFACVFSDNLASQQLLLKSGFKQEAVLQKAIYKNGRYYDNHLFALLKQAV